MKKLKLKLEIHQNGEHDFSVSTAFPVNLNVILICNQLKTIVDTLEDQELKKCETMGFDSECEIFEYVQNLVVGDLA